MALFGLLGESPEQRAQERQDFLLQEALKKLTPGAIGSTFEGFQELFAPMLSRARTTFDLNAALASNAATQGIQGSLARAGLGQTGLGAALGAGVRTGATLGATTRANTLELGVQQDLFDAARQTRALQARLLGGAPVLPQGQDESFFGDLLGLADVGLSTASLFGGGGGLTAEGFNRNFGG